MESRSFVNRVQKGQLKSKRHGELSIHFATVQETIEFIFGTIISANQLSLHGAVAETCDDMKTFTTDQDDLISMRSNQKFFWRENFRISTT